MTVGLTAQGAPASISVGAVVGDTFAVIRSDAAALALLAFSFVFIPTALTGFLPAELRSVATLVAALPSLVFNGGAALIATRRLAGASPLDFLGAAGAGASRFGSLWLMGFISSLGIVVGLILLIVPGLFLIVAWMPATAALVTEDLQGVGALDRAWQLTKGRRWSVAGVLGLVFAGCIAILVVYMAVIVAITLALGTDAAQPAVSFGLAPLVQCALDIVGVTAGAAVYSRLRLAKEGPSAEIARVFD